MATSVRRAGVLLCSVALLACSRSAPAVTSAAPADNVKQLILSDPPAADTVHPAALEAVRIPSGGVWMNGVAYLAQGPGPHATVLLLHGFPGNEWNGDLAQFLRRAGYNVLLFRYRGAWGSPGDFSIVHALEDARAALAFLRSDTVARRYRVDARRIAVVGHSMGGFVALMTAAADNGVCVVGALAPANLGVRARRLLDSAGFVEGARRREAQLGAVRGTSGEALARELVANAAAWDLTARATSFIQASVLIVVAARDVEVPAPEGGEPVVRALRKHDAPRLTAVTLDSDHSFSDRRIALAEAVVGWLQSQTWRPCRAQ